MKPGSLRAHLLAMLLAGTSLVWLAAAWWGFDDAQHEAEELLDAQLAQSARILLAQAWRGARADHGEAPMVPEPLDGRALHPYEQKLLFRILDRAGHVVVASTTPAPTMTGRVAGYADLRADGRDWRVLVVEDDSHGLRAELAQSLEIRDELAFLVALHLVLPALIALPLLGALIYLVVGRALRPLDDLAGQVSTRTAANLTRLPETGLPDEVLPLARALNNLLDRLDRALDFERRFTADAAHELRTPLAAIQVQAQVALASATDEDRRHALEQVLAGTRRGTRLVEQLLRLARLDPLASPPDAHPIDLAGLLVGIANEYPEASRPRIDAAAGTRITGNADLLAVAIRNLVDNAIRHVSPGHHVDLTVDTTEGIELHVDDDGPGVPTDELARLGERFYRGRDRLGEGSGLGLAIARRIAELHGASLCPRNRPEGGLRVTLAWPPD